MQTTFMYILAGIFNTVSLELFVLFFLMVFQVVPGRLFGRHAQNVLRVVLILSFVAGLAGAYTCYKADGYWEFLQFYAALFPAIFMPFLVLGFFSGNSDKKEVVTLYLKEGEYVIDSQVQRVGTQITAANYAYTKDKTIRFMTHIPVRPVSIKAYCEKKDGIYLCTSFEVLEKEKIIKRTKEEKRELFHTVVMVVAALVLPLPSMPMLLWYKEYGVGENPYMGHMVWSLMVVVFGGCRKLFRSGHGGASKIQYGIFNIAYYLMLLIWIIQSLTWIGKMIG
ncbi:MAG: hypothetical protein IJ409_09000 [Lachnospiraceae bacterium]|nr:hypothetical protein [Lachnospiraceae bacterium]